MVQLLWHHMVLLFEINVTLVSLSYSGKDSRKPYVYVTGHLNRLIIDKNRKEKKEEKND